MTEAPSTTEIWLPVVGYEGLYSVSSLGTVRSEARTVQLSNGFTRNLPTRILSAAPNGDGYPTVNLSFPGQPSRTLYVHDLVLAAFVGPKPNGQEARHLNDSKSDCRLSNLAYGTRSDNQRDAVRNGRNHLARRTRCHRGHEFSPGNVRRYPSRPTVRVCMACDADRQNRAKEAHQ
ncbi:NUMOD4 motif protein [Mycolicibacterium conceptionense]|uniref:NUMOD4 motif protein n=1 Tax=Mycolicibacterium conceptionense TaxID=451644 RepID=A0A0U1D2Z1_9MYCO|nr:NUMOD4 motif-containing HNH endonuclease [Mycolicibacterium conceptionense]ORV20938.1 hypothetical protein AWB98_01170 [Mycolicibacterium conceptionense]CQD07126.1 NUMOD4 motif protein [Mycolicibacterium conceptionense]